MQVEVDDSGRKPQGRGRRRQWAAPSLLLGEVSVGDADGYAVAGDNDVLDWMALHRKRFAARG